jgi:hypothetical protein
MRAYKYGGVVNENLLVLNSSDITFSDFFKNINKNDISDEVKRMVEKIDKLAYRNDVVKNLNMSDDRILFIANKTMVKNPTSIYSFGLQEWFLSYQFLNRFYDKSWVDIDKVIRFMNLYIGHRFTDNNISDEERKELSDLAKSINRQSFSQNYGDVLPANVIAEIEGKSVDDVIIEVIEPIKEIDNDLLIQLEAVENNIRNYEIRSKGFLLAISREKDETKKGLLVARQGGFKIAIEGMIRKRDSLLKKISESEKGETTNIVDKYDEPAEIIVKETPTDISGQVGEKEKNTVVFTFEGDEVTMKMDEFIDFIDNNSYLQRMDESEESGEEIAINTYDDAKEYAVQKMGVTIISETFAEGGWIGFPQLSKQVAKYYEGKPVPKKMQSTYGKTYSKDAAKVIGAKVAGKVYWQKQKKK